MNEGVGSTTIIVIIVIFIAIVSAYLAYNVNYTKAFRMKDKIISVYEKNNGKCGTECKSEIQNYALSIGYNPYNSLRCSDQDIRPKGAISEREVSGLFCEYKIKVQKGNGGDIFVDSVDEYYYRILTRIDIQIPIVQNVFNLRVLNVTGDTKTFVDG